MRGKHDGSIKKRSDQRWEGKVLLGFRNGKRFRPSFYGNTRKSVQDQIRKAVRDHEQGLPVQPGRQTMQAFLERWLTDTAKPRLRARTFEGYEQHVKKNLVPHLGHVQLYQLTPQQVQRMVTQLTESGLAPRTVAYARAVLRTALNHALRWGLVARNVATLVDVPRPSRRHLTVLDQKQTRTLLKGLTKHRLGPLFSVALALGLRLGEALGLAWIDVDLAAGTLRVRQTLQRTKEGVSFGEPKSERSRRALALPAASLETLKKHRVRQQRERLRAGGSWQQSGLVFTTPIGTALDERNVRRDFKSILDGMKLPKMRIHDLRHTCATLLLLQGVHPRTVMETLGHSQINLTMDTYSHVLPGLSREAAAQMNTILTGQKAEAS